MSFKSEIEKEVKFYNDLMNYLPPNEAQLDEKVQTNENDAQKDQNKNHSEKSQQFNQKQRNQQKQKPKFKRPPIRPGFEGAKVIKKKRDDSSKQNKK